MRTPKMPTAPRMKWKAPYVLVPLAGAATYGFIQSASALPPEMRLPAIMAGLAGSGMTYLILR